MNPWQILGDLAVCGLLGLAVFIAVWAPVSMYRADRAKRLIMTIPDRAKKTPPTKIYSGRRQD